MAAQGNDAAIDDASPLNLLVLVFVKSVVMFDAYIRVLILSIGKRARSIEVPAMPPASVASIKF